MESGAKPCTIRAPRKRPIHVGDTLYLYTGMRTKACRRLCTVTCMAKLPILIDGESVVLAGRELTPDWQLRPAPPGLPMSSKQPEVAHTSGMRL